MITSFIIHQSHGTIERHRNGSAFAPNTFVKGESAGSVTKANTGDESMRAFVDKLLAILVIIIPIFAICFVTGFGVGLFKRSSSAYLRHAVVKHIKIDEQSFSKLKFSCGGDSPIYEFDVNTNQVTTNIIPYEESRDGLWPRILSLLPITEDTAVAIISGVAGGLSFKEAWKYAFRKTKLPLDRRIAAIASVISGYGIGYGVTGIFDLECFSDDVHKDLQSPHYWEKLEWRVYYIATKSIEGCAHWHYPNYKLMERAKEKHSGKKTKIIDPEFFDENSEQLYEKYVVEKGKYFGSLAFSHFIVEEFHRFNARTDLEDLKSVDFKQVFALAKSCLLPQPGETG